MIEWGEIREQTLEFKRYFVKEIGIHYIGLKELIL